MTAQIRFLVNLPDHETIQRPLPIVFKSKFSKALWIVSKFSLTVQRIYMHVEMFIPIVKKPHSTIKACNPLGSVTFLSKA